MILKNTKVQNHLTFVTQACRKVTKLRQDFGQQKPYNHQSIESQQHEISDYNDLIPNIEQEVSHVMH